MSIIQREIRDERVLIQAPKRFAQWDKGQRAPGLRRGCALGGASGKGRSPGGPSALRYSRVHTAGPGGAHTLQHLASPRCVWWQWAGGRGAVLGGDHRHTDQPDLESRGIVQRGHCTSRPHRRSQIPKAALRSWLWRALRRAITERRRSPSLGPCVSYRNCV